MPRSGTSCLKKGNWTRVEYSFGSACASATIAMPTASPIANCQNSLRRAVRPRLRFWTTLM